MFVERLGSYWHDIFSGSGRWPLLLRLFDGKAAIFGLYLVLALQKGVFKDRRPGPITC